MPTNALTLNQSDGTEAGATTGLVTTGTGSTVTSQTTLPKSGARSIRCVITSGGSGRGVKTTTTAISLQPEPTTFTASVNPSVDTDVTVTLSSSTASFSASRTVANCPADEWTTITGWGTPAKAATDGVLTIATGEDIAVTMYVDELGVWTGIGGEWAPGGKSVVGSGTVNSNQVNYYADLAPISDLEEQAIAAGTNDNQIDWVP